MLESFLIMLREGIEAALIIGILLVVIQRTGRNDLKISVWWGLGVALAASVAAAFMLESLPINEEAYEGMLYWISATFVASMMIWMHRQAGTLKRDITDRVHRTAEAKNRGTGSKEAWGLGIFTFLMVFREGAETVMFLFAINMDTSPLMSLSGVFGGLVLAIGFCILFVNGSLNINLSAFFKVTGGFM